METLLLLALFTIALGFFIKWLFKKQNLEFQLSEKLGIASLLVLTMLGYFLNLDFSVAYGCVIGLPGVPESTMLMLSMVSFMLIGFTLINVGNFKKWFFIFEFTYWIIKLFLFKGGYAIGFGGTPSETIVIYDLISLTLRLYILGQLFPLINLNSTILAIVSFIILTLKISFFI